MAVIRIEKPDSYTSMSNYHLRDRNLSLRAIGLLSKMLSLPPEWDYTVTGLAAICREGRDAVRATLMELEAAGYMIRQQTHSASGTFSKNDYIVYERPPLTENPSTANPSTVKPLTENPTQINKDLNKGLSNIPPIVPQGGRKRQGAKTKSDWMPERFEAFWSAYPRGEKKQAAIAAWDKLHADEGLLNLMAMALKRQLSSDEWQRGIGIPYASTWLNQRRWEDEERQRPETKTQSGGWAADEEVRYSV